MATREEIIAEILKVPEEHLDKLLRIIKDHETPVETNGSNESLMSQLRSIQISAPPDFSTQARLYDPEGLDGD